MTFGEKLRELRRLNHITQAELAEELKISLRALVYYENNHRFPPRDTLVAIGNFFHVNVSYLVDDLCSNDSVSYEVLPPCELLAQVGALLSGGSLNEEDKDKFIKALIDIQNDAAARKHQAVSSDEGKS